MANWSNPLTTSTYTNFVTEVKARDEDAVRQFDPATTSPTNLPTSTIRWNSASAKWEKWNGSAWSDLVTGYAINITGSAATLTTPRAINGVNFDGSAAISVNTVQAATFNNSGSGAASGTTFNGGTARTISYNTIGAAAIGGSNATGTWPISITGNAATATSATSATSATTAASATSVNSVTGIIYGNGASAATAVTAAQMRTALGAATTSASGHVELATNAETVTGTDTVRATTPAGVKAALDAAVAATAPEWVLLDSGAVASGTNLDILFSGAPYNTYTSIKIVLAGLRTTSNVSQPMGLRTTSNAGGAWAASVGNYTEGSWWDSTGATGTAGGAAQTEIQMTPVSPSYSNTAADSRIEITLTRPFNAATQALISWEISYTPVSGAIRKNFGASARNANAIVDGIRLFLTSTSWAANGYYAVYGQDMGGT
jgi:hypothetical protein